MNTHKFNDVMNLISHKFSLTKMQIFRQRQTTVVPYSKGFANFLEPQPILAAL